MDPDTLYAVKVVRGPSFEVVRREYQALLHARHNNIVGCLHAARIDGVTSYLLCELVEGEPLAAWVRTGRRMSLADAVETATQVLDGLEVIHPDIERIETLHSRSELTVEEYDELTQLEQAGIVHRDIKPENIIRAHDGRVVLVDFGIASRSGSVIETQSATQAYLPPDFLHLSGDRWLPDIDLYAAGLVTYELICGYHPYLDSPYGTGPQQPPADVPPVIRTWLMQACAAQRADRFRSARQMRESLRNAWFSLPFAAKQVQPAGEAHDDRQLELSLHDGAGDESAGVTVPYSAWRPHPPSSDAEAEIEALVREIVAVEGPIICSRLYSLVASALGVSPASIRSRMNRLVHRLVRTREVGQAEPLGQGQIDKTLLGDGPVVPRELGPRTIWEYPKVELVALIRSIVDGARFADEGDGEDLEDELLADTELATLLAVDALRLPPEGWEARHLRRSVEDALQVIAQELRFEP